MQKINYQKTKSFWQNEAKKAEIRDCDEYKSGMLIDNDFIARYRKIEEEKVFESIVNVKKDDIILELGCGSGRWTFFLSDKCKSIVAVDFSEDMIKIAELIQEKKNVKNIKFICAEAENYCDYRKYDIIYLSSFIQYLNDEDIKKLIGHLAKMSGKRTLLISRDTISLTGGRIIKDKDYHVIYRTADEYKNMFAKYGFKTVRKQESYVAPFLSCRFGLEKKIPFKLLYFLESFAFKKISRLKFFFDDVFRRRETGHFFFVYEKTN